MTVRLDPVTDIIEIYTSHQALEDRRPGEAFVAFLYDTIAFDPLGQGIALLAMSLNISDLTQFAFLEHSRIHPIAFHTVSALFSRGLKTFYSTICRGIRCRAMNAIRHTPWILKRRRFANRSYPLFLHNLKGPMPAPTIIPRDPRPIETDLSRLVLDSHPNYQMFLWYHILAKFDVPISPAPPMRLRVMVSAIPPPVSPWTRAGILQQLRELDKMWEGEPNREDFPDVVGAWIFDADVFGPVFYNLDKEQTYTDFHRALLINHGFDFLDQTVTFDLSEKKRPELMVFEVSE